MLFAGLISVALAGAWKPGPPPAGTYQYHSTANIELKRKRIETTSNDEVMISDEALVMTSTPERTWVEGRERRGDDETVTITWPAGAMIPTIEGPEELEVKMSPLLAAVRRSPVVVPPKKVKPGHSWSEPVEATFPVPGREGPMELTLKGEIRTTFVGWSEHLGARVAEVEVAMDLDLTGAPDPTFPSRQPGGVIQMRRRALIDAVDRMPLWSADRLRLTLAGSGDDLHPDVIAMEQLSERR